MTVFLDTVGLLALWDQSDQWHAVASAAFQRIVESRQNVVTTSFILLELGNAASRRPYRLEVDQLRRKLVASGNLIQPTEADWTLAWDAYRQGNASAAEIVDHTSFVAMRRLSIQHAFTDDKHFAAAGFTLLF